MEGAHPISSKAAIVPDLVMIILEYAWDQDPHSKFFPNYSLVCSNWRHIAQRILFTSVVLNNYDAASNFLQAIQRNPALTRATKTLNISRDVVNPDDQIVREITSACPQLYQLIIALWTDLDEQRLIELLDEHTYATLQALTLTIHANHLYEDIDQLTLCSIFSFLCQFSSLSHLTLPSIARVKFSRRTKQHSLKPSFKLYELNLQRGEYRDTEIFRLTTQWFLVATDLERLRILDLGSYRSLTAPVEQEIRGKKIRYMCLDFLEHRGSGLHSLRLWMEAKTILNATRPLYITCPNLRELILLNCSLTEAIRPVLPVTYLEHLEFREASMDRDQEASIMMIEWIISLPRIRHVTIRSYPQSFLKQSLHEKCIQHGIQFRFLEYSTFDEPLSPEDPIQVSHFPRMRTITNRGRMKIPSS